MNITKTYSKAWDNREILSDYYGIVYEIKYKCDCGNEFTYKSGYDRKGSKPTAYTVPIKYCVDCNIEMKPTDTHITYYGDYNEKKTD